MTGRRSAALAAAALLGALLAAGLTDRSGAAFSSSTSSGVSTVTAASDWTPPQTVLTVPGSPLTGTVEVTADAVDEESSTTVRIDISPAGEDAWSQLCAPVTPPQACAWETTEWADGSYDLRAVATDASGNRADDVVTDVLLDNTP